MSAAKSSAGAPTAGAGKAAKPKASKTPSSGVGGVTGAPKGILKPVPISAQLGEFLGASEASRTLAVKKIWEHIKAHDLQNPSNKREIFCDEQLKILFGKDKEKVNFLEIARLLSQHFVKTG